MENKFETDENVLTPVGTAEEKAPREEQETDAEDASFEEEEDMDEEELTDEEAEDESEEA